MTSDIFQHLQADQATWLLKSSVLVQIDSLFHPSLLSPPPTSKKRLFHFDQCGVWGTTNERRSITLVCQLSWQSAVLITPRSWVRAPHGPRSANTLSFFLQTVLPPLKILSLVTIFWRWWRHSPMSCEIESVSWEDSPCSATKTSF